MQAAAAVLLMAVRREMVLAAGVMEVLVLVMLELWELLTQAAAAVVGQTQPPNKVTDMQVGQAL
jgi:type IV secretory pathway TrbD component